MDAEYQTKAIYLCGNGGSAANAMHIANDLTFGANPSKGFNVEALSANASILTCLANDIGYENIFSHQLAAKGRPGDVLIVLSGSGNSPNILRALEQARQLAMVTCAIVGFDGGKVKNMADIVIHSSIHDMQLSENVQVIVGHMLMKALAKDSASIENWQQVEYPFPKTGTQI